jgi:signal transduction histidine kinase
MLQKKSSDNKMPNFLNRRTVFMMTAFICSFIVVIVLSETLRYRNQPEKVVSRLEKYIRQSESKLKSESEKILKIVSSEKSPEVFLNKNYPDYYKENGQIFLVYQSGQLTNWTDNSFPAPDQYDSVMYSKRMLNEGNGWYLLHQEKHGNLVVEGIQLIKYGFKYNNDYLPESFFGKISLPENTNIHLKKKAKGEKFYEIRSKEGNVLFYISFSGLPRPGPTLMAVLFILFIISLLFLAALVFELYKTLYTYFNSRWLLLAFFIDIIIVRAIQFYFKIPGVLYDSELFSPIYYASSNIIPSLGDYFINVVLVLQLSWLSYRGFEKEGKPFRVKPVMKSIILVAGVIVIGLLYHFANVYIRSLVFNSSISMGFDGLFRVSFLSFTGFSIIAAILFAFLFAFYTLGKLIFSSGTKPVAFLISGLALTAVDMAYNLGSRDFTVWHSFLLATLFVTFYIQHHNEQEVKIKLSQTFLFVFLLAILANFSLNLYNSHKEKEKRRLMALHLSEYRDSLAEYKFGQVSNDILLDEKFIRILSAFQRNATSEDNVIKYLTDNHFNGFWIKYRVQITLCYPGKKLEIKPNNTIVECCDYFDNIILNHGKETSVSGLYFFDNALDMMYYSGRIAFEPSISGLTSPVFIYVEIISKNNFFAVGYPQLLLEKGASEPDYLNDYSYAIYNKKDLVKSAGIYSYDMHELDYFNNSKVKTNYDYNGYNHLFFPIDASTVLIISHRNLTLSEKIAPFSFIFLFLSLFLLFFHFISADNLFIRKKDITFGMRLQAALISIILASSVLIGTVTVLNLVRLNETKNMETVREKMNSVRYELELLLSDYQQLLPEDKNMLADILDRIANALFIDVNLYNTNGELLVSSRRQIFDDKLISTQINPVSRFNVLVNHKSYYFHNETIGNYKFLSAYATIRNYDNKVIGIINLPYFSRQTEQKQELYNFLATFANTFIILIALAILLALLISKYITKPLQLISSKLGNLQLGKANAKIEWTGRDEIGILVAEYNRMIDELGQKAELLAQSERESAWRQMARQVAHEIKNPLTPIKLSIQHLMRAWNDKAPDWEQRLNKFSQTLVMQIDTLSEIATEFSDFAQMPQPDMRRFDIVPLLNHSIGLFANFSNVTIEFKTDTERCFVNADENQMLRVFNNLIKNAVQAIPIGREGTIVIRLSSSLGNCQISITDNGTGILPEQQNRIFSPNFTTKSAGMGLGLAMVKNIIDVSGGRIWFESVPDNGTTFTVELPVAGE